MNNLKSPLQMKEPTIMFRIMADLVKMNKDLIDTHNKFISKLEEVQNTIEKKVGPKGEDGKTPDVQAIIEHIQSNVKNGKDAELTNEHLNKLSEIVLNKIPTPKDGKDAIIKKEHINSVAELVLQKLPKLKQPKDGKTPEITHEMILGALQNAPEGKKLSHKHIDGLEQTIDARYEQLKARGGYLHGGGVPSLSAGANITLVPKNDGGFTIVGGAGGGFTAYDSTEIPDGTITIFTFPTIPSQPTYLRIDNTLTKAVSKSGGINWTWDNGLKQATLSVPPQDDIEAIK
jgi:hypothetical protein